MSVLRAGVSSLRRLCVLIAPAALVLAALALDLPAQTPAPAGNRVLVTEVRGAIGVATVRHMDRAIEKAAAEGATALVLQLDTPGGLVSATRELIQKMIASPVPIIVYVAPAGARAASAGTFIVYASHLAAMAPGTNLGAATPIQMGMPGMPSPQERKDGDKDSNDGKSQTASERKAINDVVAMLRSLAELRGRNLDFADRAVREAATMTATEAAGNKVVEFVADDIAGVLAQADGRIVSTGGKERTLATKGATVVRFQPDLRTQVLAVISDPNIAFILLLIGFYGIVLEFWNPGTFVPGVVGGISIILAMIALSTLPVDYGALALLVLGIALMVAEAFTPGIGVLGIGGFVAFLAGSFFLFEGGDADIEIRVSLPLIIGAALTTAGITFGIVGAAVRSRERAPAAGAETMIGASGRVVDWHNLTGHVRVQSEIWNARASRQLQAADAVRVVGREGLTLIVES